MLKRLLLMLLLCASLGSGVVAQSDTAEETDFWWNDRVFYQIFVRSFYDSDGDGIGDLQGIIEKLDYLNDGDPTTDSDLGINAIWLMPIMPSPSYHGYDVTDYYDIHPDYGTLDDFKQLIDAAHARGIAVIIDLVLNHTSSQHPWFIDSQDPASSYADWYVWADENPNYRGPENQVVWHRKNDRFYYGVFWSEMPDLNYHQPDVTQQMYDVSRFWLELGVDGFRLDAVKFMVEDGRAQENTSLTHQWMRDYHAFVKSINPDALLVGEIWASTALVLPYVGDQVDFAFEFNLAESLVRSASFGLPGTLTKAILSVVEQYPAGQYGTFLTNHDQNRVVNQVRSLEAAKLGAYAYLTLPGVPFIYYGEEIGMTGQKPDEQIRTPMQWDATPTTGGFTTAKPWQPLNGDHVENNVAIQQTQPDSLYNVYRQLVQVRQANPALRYGDFALVESSHRRVFSFLRQSESQTVLVIINMDVKPVSDYTLSIGESSLISVDEAALLLGGDASVGVVSPEIDAQGGFIDYTPIPTLDAQSIVILEID